MSGGQQQRVALARAIVNEPKLLLLDEPLAALDRKLRKDMQIELQDLQRSLGITFVLVTHDQEEALSLSDRICVMRDGRIVQVGTPQELYDRPANRYVADFVGTSNFLPGEIAGRAEGRAQATLADGSTVVVDAAGGDERRRIEIAVRPEVLSLGDATPGPRRGRGHGTAAGHHHPSDLPGRSHRIPACARQLGSRDVLVPRRAERASGGYDVGADVHVLWAPGLASCSGRKTDFPFND